MSATVIVVLIYHRHKPVDRSLYWADIYNLSENLWFTYSTRNVNETKSVLSEMNRFDPYIMSSLAGLCVGNAQSDTGDTEISPYTVATLLL
jgi:hypothetical protein